MKRYIIKPGSEVRDRAADVKGIITHVHIESDGRVQYLMQPRGLNPEDGQPVKKMWTLAERLDGPPANHAVDLPLEVLGTQATDSASGFTGTAVAIQIHISGCLHVYIQPKGVNRKTGAPFETCDFDIRRVVGPAFKKLTEEERDADQCARPSPAGSSPGMPRR